MGQCRWLLRGSQVWRISKSLGWVPASATRDQAYEHLNQHVPDDVKCVASMALHRNHPGFVQSHAFSCWAGQACSHHGRALCLRTTIFKSGLHDEPMTPTQV